MYFPNSCRYSMMIKWTKKIKVIGQAPWFQVSKATSRGNRQAYTIQLGSNQVRHINFIQGQVSRVNRGGPTKISQVSKSSLNGNFTTGKKSLNRWKSPAKSNYRLGFCRSPCNQIFLLELWRWQSLAHGKVQRSSLPGPPLICAQFPRKANRPDFWDFPCFIPI